MLRIEFNLYLELMFGGLENIKEMIAIFVFGFLMVHINTKHNFIFFLTPYLRNYIFMNYLTLFKNCLNFQTFSKKKFPTDFDQ